MRILKIRFQNLNSLVGEWSVDLTHPEFTSNGIFAITGPTGAGKSTILDALCLALYGSTPRLERVTKSSNEIMSRQTGHCFAEVTFETPSGQFLCHWSHARAYKKPDGELQQPKHELARHPSGTIISSKLSEVSTLVAEQTGMDFNQFTRSMLLAQGGFAAFLKAQPDERATLFEQLTGTGIYSEISMRVHEIRKEKNDHISTTRARMEDIHLPTEEDIRGWKNERTRKLQQAFAYQEQLDALSKQIQWHVTHAELQQSQARIRQNLDALSERFKLFSPEARRLRRALDALELGGRFQELQSLEKSQETEKQQQVRLESMIPTLESQWKEETQKENQAIQALKQRKECQQQLAPLARQARLLDQELENKLEQRNQLREQRETWQRALEENQEKINQSQTSRDQLQREKKQLGEYLEQHASERILPESLEALRQRLDALWKNHESWKKELQAKEELEKKHQQLQELHEELEHFLEESLQKEKLVRQQLEATEEKRNALLDGKSLGDWQTQLSQLQENLHLLEKLTDSREKLVQLEQQQKSREKDRQGRRERLHMLKSDQESLNKSQAELVEKSRELQAQLNRFQTQENLEQQRQMLQPGQPCPLCGSTTHPYASGILPQRGEEELQLEETEKQLRQVVDKWADVQRALTVEKTRLETLDEDEKKDRLQRESEKQKLSDGMKNLGISSSFEDTQKVLQQARSNALEQKEHVEKRLTQIQENQTKLEEQRRQLERLRQVREERQKQCNEATQKRAGFRSDIENLVRSLEERKTQVEQESSQLQQLLGEFQAPTSWREHALFEKPLPAIAPAVKELVDWLQQRASAWKTNSQRFTTVEGDLRETLTRLDALQTQQKQARSHLEAERKKLAEMEGEIAQQRQKRKELFGERNPDDEENRVAREVQHAEEERELHREKRETSQKELESAQQTRNQLHQSMERREPLLRQALWVFARGLQQYGFSDRGDFLSADLTEDERKSIADKQGALEKEKAALESAKKENEEKLGQHLEKPLPSQPEPQLREQQKTLVEQSASLREGIGELNALLKNAEILQKQNEELATLLRSQQQELVRWNLLHDLIGSSDGKKFRNFAQGLTFQHTISHANHQLKKMSDRYLLVRDPEHPLQLNVLDNYQAGEIRSTKNLSGGESFLVSLALALGLSHMTSKKVRVDSLFLDEGFGTLDEEALDTALEALSTLQQQGKMVGVISHVGALKERLSTQIQVEPLHGGRSQISGPGCQKLSD